jgi:lipid II isoglutaminyl synthase (glutamine-hydrolysing)
MRNAVLILLGKTVSKLAKTLNLGNGSTWPGHIALIANPQFTQDLLKKSPIKTIFVAGTNGKTTTVKLIQTALEESGKKVIQNTSGANLLNGIASTLLLNTNTSGSLDYDYAIFEVDENALPQLLSQITPDYLVLLNLFRDQLDRYGEVNTIVYNWKEALAKLSSVTTLLLNADDPQIAYLAKGIKAQVKYFGLQPSQFGKSHLGHAADSVYCPKCGEKLTFDAVAFSHLGDWHCKKCQLKRPKIETDRFTIYPLPGLYNKYNVLGATLVLKQIGLTDVQINHAFTDFTPAFGRQEIITYKDKQIQIFLSKNPTSFNQSYTTIQELGGKTLLLVLNDRIPDGKDVSWIWDIDLPKITAFKHILIAGDRVYDMALRIKYEGYKNFQAFENLEEAIEEGIKLVGEDTFFILPTYSAMLEVRKIVTGKKIL